MKTFQLTRRQLAAASLALAVPGRAQRQPDLIRYGLSAWPPNLQPWPSTGASAGTVKMLIHRRLTSYNARGELVGELAREWGIDEQGAWVFRLRPEARFQNGEAVTAEDVKWTIEQIAGERSTAYYRTQFQAVERIDTPDAHTVRLVTKEPLATVPLWFANYNMPICWRGSRTTTDPVGAGPYRIASQERGTFIELQAVPNHWQTGIPRTPRIRFVIYADENLRLSALQAGDVDMIEYVPWPGMAQVEADPRLKLDAQDGPFMDLLFNGTRPPFNDPRVRQACAFAIRREDIVQVAFSGRGKPIEGVPIFEGTPWWDAELSKGLAYNPDRARQLLSAAGHPNGFSTVMLATSQFGMHKDTAEVAQQHLAAVGIRAELRLVDWSTRVNLGTRGQYEIAVHGVSSDFNDPDGLTVVMDTTLSPTHGRSFGVQAPRTVAALARGRAEFDHARRVEIYKDFQRAAMEEVPIVGLAFRSQGYGMDRRVQGFVNLPGALTTSSGSMLEVTTIG
jgi:peptide/nickel transport system substrate-binding protein